MERSLRSARERALTRSQRFIAVATQLLHESGSLDFTVQDLVGRSGMSLRSFYQHFASKDDLLLAVLEEAISGFVSSLRVEVEALEDPLDRLRGYITGFSSAGTGANQPASRALSQYLLWLTQSKPAELARVLHPQISLLQEIIEAGVAREQLRADIQPRHLTLLVTQTLMATVEMNVLGSYLDGDQITDEELWSFCTRGVVAAKPR